MTFRVEIDVMPLKEILDPQGKAVQLGLKNLGISGMHDVRVGKHIQLWVEADTEDRAREEVDKACKKLLANLIMESYQYTLHKV